MKIREILDEVGIEVARAQVMFPRLTASAHEGFAVLKEEVDELWDEVRGKSDGDQEARAKRRARMRKEAVQVAAMAVRFIQEVCE